MNIIHTSIIFIYPVTGNSSDTPIKLNNKDLQKSNYLIQHFFIAYKVVRTRSRVVLTSITISLNDWLKAVETWLMVISIPVGRNRTMKLCKIGLFIIRSMNNPFFRVVTEFLKFKCERLAINHTRNRNHSSTTLEKKIKLYFEVLFTLKVITETVLYNQSI